MDIRELAKEEFGAALALSLRVFQTYEAPDYGPQGSETFCASIRDEAYLAGLRIYGAFEAEALIGVLATRSGGTHIALFFVEGAYHRRGVGRQLFLRACRDNPAEQMTVNSSPFAVEVYRRLGFCETDAEQTVDGIRYTPMRCQTGRADCPCKRTHCERHGSCVLCRAHHADDKQSPPACERPTREERRELRRQKHAEREKKITAAPAHAALPPKK